ncbi:hypothetical protein PUN28_016850 [Cardiocondyla obscurior]|uniref:Uncharacterized protein n=1 Tax=Cardiocondyla obscurior TaxID=286306 RepID=A0AAW2ESU4_9HYME
MRHDVLDFSNERSYGCARVNKCGVTLIVNGSATATQLEAREGTKFDRLFVYREVNLTPLVHGGGLSGIVVTRL